MVDELIEVKLHNKASLLLTFASSEKRVLDINRFNIQHHHLSEAIVYIKKIFYSRCRMKYFGGGWNGYICYVRYSWTV